MASPAANVMSSLASQVISIEDRFERLRQEMELFASPRPLSLEAAKGVDAHASLDISRVSPVNTTRRSASPRSSPSDGISTAAPVKRDPELESLDRKLAALERGTFFQTNANAQQLTKVDTEESAFDAGMGEVDGFDINGEMASVMIPTRIPAVEAELRLELKREKERVAELGEALRQARGGEARALGDLQMAHQQLTTERRELHDVRRRLSEAEGRLKHVGDNDADADVQSDLAQLRARLDLAALEAQESKQQVETMQRRAAAMQESHREELEDRDTELASLRAALQALTGATP